MAQQARIGKYQTRVHEDAESITVRLYDTNIVTVDKTARTVTLDTGGWLTSMTKTRMNQAAHELGLGFYVYQKDFQFYVSCPDSEDAFDRKVTFSY